MEKLRLAFACGRYDRMEALRDGTVEPQGIDLHYTPIDSPREVFDRAVGNGEFDLFEFSISEYVRMAARATSPFVALPVFPSRQFRHGFIFINKRAGIVTPRDLAGKRIGMGLYTQTASVWIRGHLSMQFGADLSGVTWVQGAIEKPGLHGTPKSLDDVPQSVTIEQNRSDKSLSALLAENAINALIGARIPEGYPDHPDVDRLFPDYQRVEKDFYRRTGIFPIMHLIAIRREVYERNTWIGESLLEAFERSRVIALERLRFSAAPKTMLPWQFSAIEEMDAAFGTDPWPLGIEPNRPTLEAIVAHLDEQGLVQRRPKLEELFVPA